MSSAFAHSSAGRDVAPLREPRVVIVPADPSSHAVARALLAGAILNWPGTVALGSMEDLADADYDAVVLVADIAASTGMAALRRIRKETPSARLVVVAGDDQRSIAAREALNAGAEAFVLAEHADRALRPALDAVIAGLVGAPRGARRLVAKPTFSHREKEVLELLVAGLTNGQIAARLHLAESTVKTHLATAFGKLGVRSRKDAVALLVDPAEGLAVAALPPTAAMPGAR